MGAHREGDRLASGAAVADAVVWHFANIVFDEGAMELRVAGRATDAEPKAMELLQLLLRRAGEVVTRQEILDAIWPGRIINDGGLTNCVSKLRAALGDHDQAIVRTVPRFGYRLMAEVHSLQVAARAIPTTSGTGLAVGDPVPGREDFHLERLLAEAGQAEVWLARQHPAASERRVYKFARSEQELTLLKREITLNRVLAESQNGPTGFVPLLSWNLERAPYFAELAYAAHGSLPDWLERRGGIDALSLAERLDIVTQCAVAMSAAHAVGVLHKDLKPANILVAGENPLRIQLCDLGAGSLLDAEICANSSITRYGFTRVLDISDDGGTPLYVAPEVLAGRPPTALSDIYALGVLLFQLVVGDLRRAFSPGWETQVDHPLLREDIAIAARGDPAQRFSDAGLLALRLRSLETRQADHEALLRQLASAEASRQNLLRRRAQRGLKLALAASMAFAVVSTTLLGWQWLSARSAAAPSGDLAACRTGIAER